MVYIKQFFITGIIFFFIDLIWLGVVAKRIYGNYLGHLMSDQVNMVAAGLFYFFFIIALIYFVIQPALVEDNIKMALVRGMFFGFITYATYDLTNLATLRDWPLTITVIDLIWGTCLCGFVSLISSIVIKRFS